jgi:DnaJ domain
MADETYYSLLGVSETASAAEIRIAYRRLMLDVHPDRLANAPAYWQRQAEERAKEINGAFAVLSDPEKRRLYDFELSAKRQRNVNKVTDPQRKSAEPASSPRQATYQSASSSSSAQSKKEQGRPVVQFSANLTLLHRLFFALIFALFGFGAMLGFWHSASFGEGLFRFILSGSFLFAILCLFQRQISHFLNAIQVRAPGQQLLFTVGVLVFLLLAGKIVNILLSSSVKPDRRPLATESAVTPVLNPQESSVSDSTTSSRTDWATPISLPNGTQIIKRRRTGGYGKFAVDNGTAYDAVIELVDTQSKRAIRAFYVGAGQNFTEDHIGLGTYAIYYMTGEGWNASTKLFNRVTEFGSFDEKATFAEQRNDETGEVDFHVFRITLQPVAGGTARTSGLNADEFKNAMVPLDTQ